jgi:predicted ATPase
MIESISLRHFKCFTHLDLRLGALTVLSGYNAAGKSSSTQPLLLLAQSAENSSTLRLNGRLVHLGSPGEVLSFRAPDRVITFAAKSEAISVEWRLEPSNGDWSSSFLALTALTLSNGRFSEPLSLASILPTEPQSQAAALFSTVRSLVYISAARAGLVEVFPIPEYDATRADVGSAGEFAGWAYSTNADDEIPDARRHPHEAGTTLRRQVDAYLGDLFPGATANAEIIPKTALTRVNFRTGYTSDWLRPANVGYGYSYAFPILVALLLAEPGQMVVVDSPEAHLHPHAQSVMGRHLARFASAGVQVVVETHSDHVLNGMRLAVRERLLRASALAIHFFSGGTPDREAQVVSPRIDSRGSLSEWPEGFFDQAEADLTSLTGLTD